MATSLQETQTGPGFPLWTALLAAAAVALYGLGESVQGLLHYDRGAVLTGEVWRLLTQHWTHWSVDHLLWDVLVFAGLGTVCELRNRRRFLCSVATAAVAISLGLLYLLPHVPTCRGLSGLDSALFAMLALDWLRRGGRQRALGGAAVVLFLGKCVSEQAIGMALFVKAAEAAMVPVPLAHWLGFACGGIWGWVGWEGRSCPGQVCHLSAERSEAVV
jgi:rhomboid family GlyGly-CTERM serine protease